MESAELSLDLATQALLQPWLVGAPAIVLLQVVALVRLRGAARSLVVVLGVVTGAILGLVVAAYALDPGNLWELLLRLSTPPLFVLTVGVLVIGLIVGPGRSHDHAHAS